jgi:hypothetical protein
MMRQKRRRRHPRRGAAILEMSIILSVFLTLTFGMIDLGMGVYRYHILTNAACQGARRATVHGSQANVLGVWGPTTIDVPATANGIPIVDGGRDGLQNMLVGCSLPQTRIKVEWIDGSNAEGKRVRVTVTSPYRPFMPFLQAVTLIAASTMQIAH